MTRKDTLEQIKALGMSALYSPEAGEYRVTLRAEDEPSRERREAIAYYTHDANDALGTARAMRETFDQQQAAKAEGPERHTERHVENIANMKGAAFEAACEAKEEANFAAWEREMDAESAALDAELTSFTPDEIPESPLYGQTADGLYRVTDKARAAIEELAALVPDQQAIDLSERIAEHIEPHYRDGERDDALAGRIVDRFEVEGIGREAAGAIVQRVDALPAGYERHLKEAVAEGLADHLPERHPLHRDEPEPTEAEITRHMMTGEEPRVVSPFAKAGEKLDTPEAKAQRLAQRQASQARGYDGPEL